MKKTVITLLAALSAVLVIAAAGQIAVAQPKTLDELLGVVKRGAVKESEEYRQRIREFEKARNNQQTLLKQAQTERRRQENRSEQLENKFNDQEEELEELTETLNERLGSLRELFGVLQQVSGDTRGKFETSLISAQFPGRGEFLGDLAKKMGTATELATIEEIERIVYELQREMTESGKVVRFQADVIEPGGNKQSKQVVRVGAFSLVADGNYLEYDPDSDILSELARQPAKRFLSTAAEISNATDGYVRFALDPSRGSILSLLVQAPNLAERVSQGGFIGYLIIAIGLLGLLIALWRLVAISVVGSKVTAQITNSTASAENPLGRVLLVHEKNQDIDTESLELKLSEAILKELPDISKYISLLKIIAVVAPLMGLLGTVTGMINTFQAITLFGAGDPKLMAGGISQALVTTMLGLWVAIPMTLMHSIVNTRSKGVVHVLEEQAAGIVAAHNEKTHA